MPLDSITFDYIWKVTAQIGPKIFDQINRENIMWLSLYF